jgi:DNA polymerase III delta' subunit
MTWDDLVGQDAAKKYLRAAVAARRQAHAFLFKGPVGVGKRTAARIFAKALLCQERGDGDAACGECRSCRTFAAGTNPDLIPLRKMTDAGGEVGDHETVVRLETVQFVCEQLHRSPMMGRRRVVIIPEAQRLCQGQAESANAFLKTLEEPPAAAAIILTSSRPEGLLETIVSRVQGVQFRRLSAAEIRSGLALRAAGKAEADRELVVSLADGSLGRALELLNGDLRAWRASVVAGLGKLTAQTALQFGLGLWMLAEQEGERLASSEKDSAKAAADDEADGEDDGKAVEGAAKTESGWKRYVYRRLLEVCEVCFRDGLVCAADESGSSVMLQPDQQQLSRALAANFGEAGCAKVLAALREALLATRLYVRGDVTSRALGGKLVEAMSVRA